MAVDLVNGQSLERFFQMSNHEFDFSGLKRSSVAGMKRTGHARFRRGPASDSTRISPVDEAAKTSGESTQYMQTESGNVLTQSTETTTPSESTQSKNTETCGELTRCMKTGSLNELTQSRRETTSDLTRSSASCNELTHSVKVAKRDDLTRSIKVTKYDDLTVCNTTTSGRSFAGEGSVSDGKGIVTPAPVFSSRKPPLPSSHRKRQGSMAEGSVSRGCHCCKRRKILVKKVTSIPADNYSWKKYGEKSVEGSPYPKVYYKCSTARGCPARKRIEVARDDSKMLIVSYAGEHRHGHIPTPVPAYLSIPFRLN